MPSDHDDRGPLTPDELAKVRDRYAPCSPWVDGRRLLATVDAERAARERAEAERDEKQRQCDGWIRSCLEAKDAHRADVARAKRAEQQLAAITKALDLFLAGENKTDRVMPERLRTAYRAARALLDASTTEELIGGIARCEVCGAGGCDEVHDAPAADTPCPTCMGGGSRYFAGRPCPVCGLAGTPCPTCRGTRKVPIYPRAAGPQSKRPCPDCTPEGP